jgi:hypothetical protein
MRRSESVPAIAMLALALGSSACASKPPRADGAEPSATEVQDMQKQTARELPFVHGPRIAPDGALQTWLRTIGAESPPRLVQLVFTITSADARVGVLGTARSPQAVSVPLDDSALGIALAERVRAACPDATSCAVWLEGYWQGRVLDDGSFKVTRVVAALTAEERGQDLFARVVVDETAPRELVQALDRLGDPATPIAVKRDLGRQLTAAGKDAVPLLIASLQDERPYETRDIANRMNLPNGQNPEPVFGTTTVGMRAADLLYVIITPAPTSSSPYTGKVISEQILSVTDWPRFWRAYRGLSLDQIHARLAPLVDRYWATHGTTQVVPLD